jgi:Methylase involved in ubiquinone/menaquinone biosynthesis
MSDGYNESTYGDRVAEVYDQWHPAALPEMIALLKDLAGTGPVLELGIGSGRVALPLAAQGVEVHGIDASEAMLARLRAKSGAESIAVTIGNFAEVAVDGNYSLVFIAFNTFFMLLSQEEQVQCFANVAKRLRPGGLFLIEAFVPNLTRFTGGQVVQATEVGADEVKLEFSRHDPVAQHTISQQVVITAGGIKLYPIEVRYAWPSELDLMARLAGMRLRDRWSSWQRTPFTAASTSHISVYELL